MEEKEKKIYVESLLSDEDYRECANTYSTYKSNKKPAFFKSDFMWRYRMGMPYTEEQCKRINDRIDILLQKVN